MQLSRESIFVSSIRSFCNAFFALLGIVFCLFAAVIVFSLAMPSGKSAYKSHLAIKPDAEGSRVLLPASSPVILKIDVHGTIGEKKLNAQGFENILLSADELIKKGRIKGVLLNVNSPGGLTTDSNTIYEQLESFKAKHNIPIYAYVDGLCASGGYYICAAAEKIYASPPSIIGSVGAIMGPIFNFHDLMQQYNIQARAISKGIDKGILNPFLPYKEKAQTTSLQPIVDQSYEYFVDVVVKNRQTLDKQKLIHEYGAKVYSAVDAKELGFIDEANANYNQTLQDLVTHLDIKEKYQVYEVQTPPTVIEGIFELNSSLSDIFLKMIFGKNATRSNHLLYEYKG